MSHVLALNGGSSSLKYAVFEGDRDVLRGEVDHIGAGGAKDHAAAVAGVFDRLAEKRIPKLTAVGHRIVHGGPDHVAPERVTPALMDSLQRAIPFAPLHLPAELRAIEAVRAKFGELPQVVCFDTAFHHAMPEVAHRYALPRALFERGVRRYGFHGLSYEFVVSSLDAPMVRRAVIAHLGSGASMVAIRDGKSIDTTMGFTPTAGLVMSSRSGDMDPGLVVYLLEHGGYDAKRLEHVVNHESGLLALSETTPDMQRLLGLADSDPRAALAVDVFCYGAAKWVGSFAAALGGLESLVFTGGIGEHSAEIRSRITSTLGYLGIAIDVGRNTGHGPLISTDDSPCEVRVVKTDEERMIARHTARAISD